MSKVIIGGENSVNEAQGKPATSNFNPRGVYATHPGMTPKYDTGFGAASATQARLLFEMDSKGEFDEYIAKMPERYKIFAEGLRYGYMDFFAAQISESFDEKVQVSEVLSDKFVSYYFGSRPPMFSVTGTLLNSRQDDWSAAFHMLYRGCIRGTKLAEAKRGITLSYDSRRATGSLMNFRQTLNAQTQLYTSFSFQFLVHTFTMKPEEYRLPTYIGPDNKIIKHTAPTNNASTQGNIEE